MTRSSPDKLPLLAALLCLTATPAGGCSDDGGRLSGGDLAEDAGGESQWDDAETGGDDDDDAGDDDDDGDGSNKFDIGTGDDDETPPESEDEQQGNFKVPQASGRFVYSASESTNRVAVIDTATLTIDVVNAGRTPTVVAALPLDDPNAGAVAVLSPGSDQITMISTSANGENVVVLRDITGGANNLAVSPHGRFVVSYHDVDIADEGSSGSDQEISILPTSDLSKSYAFTVGAHPRRVLFDSTGQTVYISTDDGVNLIPTAELDTLGKPDLVPVTEETGVDPSTVEVQVAAEAGLALTRIQDEKMLLLTNLLTREQIRLDLEGFPTDVDIAADGTFAVVVLPRKSGSTVLEIPLPVSSVDQIKSYSIGEEYVGVSHLAADGNTMLLYTTVNPWEDDDGDNPDPRNRLTIARRWGTENGWTNLVSVFTEIPIRSLGIAPDSSNAVLLHDRAPDLNPAAPWPYTLLDLRASFPIKKLQNVEARPSSVLFTPDGKRSSVLVRDDEKGIRRIDMINLANFIVSGIPLGSPPEGLGYVEVTDKIFVSQVHESGRISFVDSAGAVETATGFELNDSVKD